MFGNVSNCTDDTTSYLKGLGLTAEQLSPGPMTVSSEGVSGFIKADKLGTANNASI